METKLYSDHKIMEDKLKLQIGKLEAQIETLTSAKVVLDIITNSIS